MYGNVVLVFSMRTPLQTPPGLTPQEAAVAAAHLPAAAAVVAAAARRPAAAAVVAGAGARPCLEVAAGVRRCQVAARPCQAA